VILDLEEFPMRPASQGDLAEESCCLGETKEEYLNDVCAPCSEQWNYASSELPDEPEGKSLIFAPKLGSAALCREPEVKELTPSDSDWELSDQTDIDAVEPEPPSEINPNWPESEMVPDFYHVEIPSMPLADVGVEDNACPYRVTHLLKEKMWKNCKQCQAFLRQVVLPP
jgi:hypothetical protein